MEEIRINKYLASLGVGSRREIDKLIEEGKIRVNGEIISAGVKVTDKDIIEVKGKNSLFTFYYIYNCFSSSIIFCRAKHF